ncbi:MAG: hypothetical protein ACI8RZ_002127 [Myxococcota bacterium]|jgi:hypothetical protein
MLSALFLLAIGCVPKAPPAGSLDISESVGVAGVGGTDVFLPVPIPMGAGYPWTGEAKTDAQRSLLAGEAILVELMVVTPTTPADLEAAITRSDDARDALAVAAEEVSLKCPADARFGDVMVELLRIFAALEPPTDGPEAEWSEREQALMQSYTAFLSSGVSAYDSVLTRCPSGSPWARHATHQLNVLTTEE